jgi:small subunit ribosomal protein S8
MAKIKFTNDILADSLTRIRNAVRTSKETVVLANTKLVLELLKVLSNQGFIAGYMVNEADEVVVNLKVDGKYRFSELIRVSKPGVRKYVSADELTPVKGGRGLAVLSTSKGVMSGYQARKEGIGGEYLCKIW